MFYVTYQSEFLIIHILSVYLLINLADDPSNNEDENYYATLLSETSRTYIYIDLFPILTLNYGVGNLALLMFTLTSNKLNTGCVTLL